MAIYRRGEIWWVRFTTPTGRRVRRSTKTTNRKAAQEFHDRLKADLWRTEALQVAPNRTWDQAASRWLEETRHKADHVKDAAKLGWLQPILKGRKLQTISTDVLREVAQRKALEASSPTANRYVALVRAILRRAANEWGWLDRAPSVRLATEPKRRIRWLTHEEAERLVGELPEHLADMCRFSLATGLRAANVTGIMWEQVDLVRAVAWIHPDQAKARKAIAIPLNADAVNLLRKLEGGHRAFVFTFKGRPIKRANTRAWSKALERAGIADFRWHDLRHTWASWHVQAGTPLHVLQELGGWETVEMVRRYAHFAPEHLAEHASRVEWCTTLTHPETKKPPVGG